MCIPGIASGIRTDAVVSDEFSADIIKSPARGRVRPGQIQITVIYNGQRVVGSNRIPVQGIFLQIGPKRKGTGILLGTGRTICICVICQLLKKCGIGIDRATSGGAASQHCLTAKPNHSN